jgi:uncharacterized membrane protein YbhN (UPF0104 family)
MPEAVVRGLITLAVLMLCWFLIPGLTSHWLHLPPMVMFILGVILVLIAILFIIECYARTGLDGGDRRDHKKQCKRLHATGS